MITFRVEYSDEAEDDLDAIRRYIAGETSHAIAARFTAALTARCEKLASFPDRGTPRDDLGPGVRSVVHKRNVLIVYKVRGDAAVILGFFYGGRDVGAAFRDRAK